MTTKKAKKKTKKKVKVKSKKPKKTAKAKRPKYDDPNILEIVEKEIELTCPINGKIKRRVKVKIMKPVTVDNKQFIGSSEYIDQIDSDDSPIYGTTEPDEEDDG